MGWEDVADELYALPPESFTAARDEAARAAPRGQAARIRALRRPTLAAWAVNLLVRREREQVEAVLGLGEQLRRAHRDLDGRQLRDLSQQQHRLVTALAGQARRITAEAGRPVPDSALRDVEATLQAALADPDAARELAAGRLTRAFAPVAGFGPADEATVYPLRPPGREAPGRTGPRGRADRPAEGRAGPGRAAPRGKKGTEAETSGAGVPAPVTDLTERGRQRERAERERRERLDRARRDAQHLRQEARTRADEATAAERGLADAEDRFHRAQRRVEELTEQLRHARNDLSAARRERRAAGAPAERARDAAERARTRAEEGAAEVERARKRPPGRPARRGRRGT